MTARPALEDLDATPEPARWCCNGNAEDCPLCDTAALPHPCICPGHPDTTENRQRVQAAAEATESAPWPQLEARAFNAVGPALREVGEWLPLSARRAVAKAVLAAIQPHLAGHYNHAVDAALEAERRAERAEATVERVRAALPPYDRPVHGDTSRGVQMGWDRARQAALDAIDGEQTAPAPKAAATEAIDPLTRYRDWLADELAKAETRDQATGEVPAELRISPHNGIASGIRTALYGLDRILDQQPATLEEQP